MALGTQILADWLTALTPIPFNPGPEVKEFGRGNLGSGSVTRVPGGAGKNRDEGTEEQMVQILVEGRARAGTDRLSYTALEQAINTIDDAFEDISNELIWGTYVRTALRQGSLDPAYIADERVQFVGLYLINEGLAP